jgi:hypothetical protein
MFVVNDGSLHGTPVSRTVTVVPVNDTPTATTLTRRHEDAGRTIIDLLALFADAEDADSLLSSSGRRQQPVALRESDRSVTGQLILDSAQDAFGPARSPSARPTPASPVETTINLTVTPVNDAPVVTISPGVDRLRQQARRC